MALHALYRATSAGDVTRNAPRAMRALPRRGRRPRSSNSAAGAFQFCNGRSQRRREPREGAPAHIGGCSGNLAVTREGRVCLLAHDCQVFGKGTNLLQIVSAPNFLKCARSGRRVRSRCCDPPAYPPPRGPAPHDRWARGSGQHTNQKTNTSAEPGQPLQSGIDRQCTKATKTNRKFLCSPKQMFALRARVFYESVNS